jgi:hypothetical protein
MRLEDYFQHFGIPDLFEAAFADFVLAFAFFTALFYAMLAKRIEHQRSAIVISSVMGFVLSIGFIWWEEQSEFRMENLGAIAVGFAILILAFVMYQAIKQIGGSWAGAGITIGASLLVASLFELDLLIDPQIIYSIMVVALVVGILSFLMRHRGHYFPTVSSFSKKPVVREIKRDMSSLYRDRSLSDRLTKSFRTLRKESKLLEEHPQEATDVMLQLKRILPAEGWLTERMAQLRAKAYKVRNGHIAHLEETKDVFRNLPTHAKKKAAAQLMEGYSKIIGIDNRLERLDKTVAEVELRIREITKQAAISTQKYEFKKLPDLLKAAEKLQHHNSKLFNFIKHYEKELLAIVKRVAKEAGEVDKK